MQATYEYTFSVMRRMDKGIEMKKNEAYGPVSSSHPPPPPTAPERAYDL